MELKDFINKDSCYLIRHWNRHPDDLMFKTKQGKKLATVIRDYVSCYKEIRMV